MDQCIIYPFDGRLAIVRPVPGAINPATGEVFTIAEIAAKDVPAGLPFIIIDVADIPEDRTYRDAWVADFSEPNGVGMGAEAWFAANPPAETVKGEEEPEA